MTRVTRDQGPLPRAGGVDGPGPGLQPGPGQAQRGRLQEGGDCHGARAQSEVGSGQVIYRTSQL